MIVVRPQKSVVAFHLVVNGNGHTEGWVQRRLNGPEYHGVLVVLLVHRLLLLPLFTLLAVVRDFASIFESIQTV